jgi:hypothetical protein
MKCFSVIVLSALLGVSVCTASAQNERALHPRIARAIAKRSTIICARFGLRRAIRRPVFLIREE